MSSLRILEIRPLSEVSLANMFSHTVDSYLKAFLKGREKDYQIGQENSFFYSS